MANIDIPIKRLMQSNISDWVELLIPDCKEEWIREMDAEKIPAKKESRLDKLVLIEAPNEKYILNIEPQGYLDYKMPARMLRYRADIWEYTMGVGLGTPSIKQAVIYFYKNHDNKQYILQDKWNDDITLDFSYKAVRIWELNKQPIIERKLKGLYPLIPLMERYEEETDELIIEKTVETIKTVEDISEQADLLAVMSIISGEKFSSEIVKKYVRRDMLMNSAIYNEWVEEERRESAIKASKEATIKSVKKNLIELLEGRFDIIPLSVRKNIEIINEEYILDELFKKAIKIGSIEEFEALLAKALKVIEA